MRLIDADALLDTVFKRYCEDCDKRKGMKNGKMRTIYAVGDAPCRACGIDDMIGELEDAPTAQPEPQWIPCSDRYPDMDERVLVYTVAHEYHVWDCMSNRADNYFWEDESGLYHDKYVVDLWLPLPEPWKGEEHDKG